MYNAERYIGALLESLFAQTFTDFEVIIADDCSTDSSCAVVESYMSKFGGRLKLVRMKNNSGSPGAPCNKVVAYAVGKYVYQMDNDDLLTNTALETFYTTAENFGADVVSTTAYFHFADDTQNPVPNPEIFTLRSADTLTDAATLDDIGERLKLFCMGKIYVMGWLSFARREFLLENDIVFQEDVKASQDITWTIELLCQAKSYVRIATPLYIYRRRPDSVYHSSLQLSAAETLKFNGELFVKGAAHLCKFFGKQKFFRENPRYAWMLLDWLERRYSVPTVRALAEVSPQEVQRILQGSFAKEFGEYGDLLAYLFTSINSSRLMRKQQFIKIKQLKEHAAELERRLKT